MNDYLIKALRDGRIKKGLKQSDVAVLLGVKGGTLSNYENGISEPDIDTFAMLCEIYNLDFAYILSEAYGLAVQGSDFTIKPSEITLIERYRSLDDHGKDMVDTVLNKEYDRCQAQTTKAATILPLKEESAPYTLNAAHERTDIEVTDEMRKHDDDIMDGENF